MKKRRRKSQRFSILRGLGRAEVYKAASKKATQDFRGFKYDRKTGACVLT